MQNKKPFQTKQLYKWGCLAAVIPQESRSSEDPIILSLNFGDVMWKPTNNESEVKENKII